MELARESMFLCHGIGFSPDGNAPALRLRQGVDWISEPLEPGREMSLDIGERKWCLGYVRGAPDGHRVHERCKHRSILRTGTQCPGCRRLDQTRYMHQFHRTGEAPEGLRRYLEQPHFLYVASFANGATKVGTTSTDSRWTRLAAQGVIAARYIARAMDGAAIRILEDLLTEHCGLGQQVRQKAKVQGLCSWNHDLRSALEINDAAAGRAREFLTGQKSLEVYGIELLDEPWRHPGYSQAVIQAWDERRLHAWPGSVTGQRISLRIQGVLGQGLMVDMGPQSHLMLLDAAELKTRALVIGQAQFQEPSGQGSLF